MVRDLSALRYLFVLAALAASPTIVGATGRWISRPNQDGRGEAVPRSMNDQVDSLREPGSTISLHVKEVPLERALRAVAEQANLSLVFDGTAVAPGRKVTCNIDSVSIADAFREVLRDTGLEAVVWRNRQVVIQKVRDGKHARAKEPTLEAVVSGIVIDSASQRPVNGATVVLDKMQRGATTGEDGRFSINGVTAGRYVLTARRLGYSPRSIEVVVGGAESVAVRIALAAVPSTLVEVVTTVTGEQRRLEIGNAIGRINADSVAAQTAIASFSDLITARAAGTQVVLNSGFTGSAPRVRIRGLNSLAVGNDPLLVVDGIRVDNSSAGRGSGFGQTSGRFDDLNPDEIESIDIVKGPSAATLYGTDAANGVLIVRTKRGRPGRPAWRVTAEGGLVGEPARFPDNYFSWGHATAGGTAQQCLLAQRALGQCVIDSLTTWNPLMNRETTPLGTGQRGELGAQVSGGVAQFRYFFGGEFENETGFLRMPDLDRAILAQERGGAAIPEDQLRPNALRRTRLRGNLGVALGTNADLNLSAGLVATNARIPTNDVFNSAQLGPGFRNTRDGWHATISRPSEAFSVRNEEEVLHYTNGAGINWNANSWLTGRGTVGLDYSWSVLDDLQRRGEGPLGVNRDGRRATVSTGTAQYSADLGASATASPRRGLNFRTTLGVQYNSRLAKSTTATGTNLSLGSETISGAATVTASETTTESVVAGGYLEQGVGLSERLFLTVALRADGASAFGRDFRTAFYPKASASWIAVENSQGMANTVRLRAAYGASGVQPNATAALALISLSPSLLGGTTVTGARVSAIGNPDLKPERQAEFEAGVDVDAFERRLHVEGTYYNRLSRDALINRPLASEFPVVSRQENIGSVRNSGIEWQMALALMNERAFGWDVSLNGSANKNRLERIGDGIPFVGGSALSRSVEGRPLFSKFARPIIGFADANGDGILTESEVQVGDSLLYLGQSLPTRQFTAATSVRLLGGRLRASTQFDYRGGHTNINIVEANRCGTTSCRGINDPGAPLWEQARAVAFRSSALGRTFAGYIEDGAFVRWRELSVAYALPRAIARAVRAQSADMMVTGRNLRLFTDFSGADPEVNADPGALEGYSANAAAPPARYWLFRINLGF
jgi:TonB-linked SusC/RagA family outer membrane protein